MTTALIGEFGQRLKQKQGFFIPRVPDFIRGKFDPPI